MLKAASYLGDEGPVFLDLVVIGVAASQELPDLSPQRLWDSTPHQGWERLWPDTQVEMPVQENHSTVEVKK